MIGPIELGVAEKNQDTVQIYQSKLSNLNENIMIYLKKQKIQELDGEIKFLNDLQEQQILRWKSTKIYLEERKEELKIQSINYNSSLERLNAELERLYRQKKKNLNNIKDLNFEVDNIKVQIQEYIEAPEQGEKVNQSKSRKQVIEKCKLDINEAKNLYETRQQEIKISQQNILLLKEQIKEQVYKRDLYKYSKTEYDSWQNTINEHHSNFMKLRDDQVKLNKEIEELVSNGKKKDEKKQNITTENQKRNQELKNLQNQKLNLEHSSEQNRQDIQQLSKLFKDLYSILEKEKGGLNIQSKFTNLQWTKAQQLMKPQVEIPKQIIQQPEIKEQIKQPQLAVKLENPVFVPQKAIQPSPVNTKKMQIQDQGHQAIKEAKQSHGQLDVCFLVDVTNSMDKYKEQTINSIQKSVQIIKQTCNRDVNLAAVCYQDFAEKNDMNGEYKQFNFTKDSYQLGQWMENIQCQGGGDTAEDVRGAMKQMCQLNWSSRFRICILICDAPCHGQQYNGGVNDNYQREDIRDAILELIDKKIILIGLIFNRSTIVMYQQIRSIYYEMLKHEQFLFFDVQNLRIEDVAHNMAVYLGQATEMATQINVGHTKLKKLLQAEEQVLGREGAIEALCKHRNFENFENTVNTIDVDFQVYRVELKEAQFKKYLQDIRKLQVPQDFTYNQEGQWKCIRTESPFAFGVMKDVFLMKKKQNYSKELYVIKAPKGGKPYQTMNEALQECRSHLVCQKLLKNFYKDLDIALTEKKITKKYIEVIYSDFLILKESQNSFWIAERFFNGEFIKYNNNFGFISDSMQDLNKIAQAFTYYTYCISDFNYLVCDIQGVGPYFTDPAINTNQGDFDDSDIGQDGIMMFLVTYEQKKASLAKEILDILGIYDEK